jgi:hypothetical protein
LRNVQVPVVTTLHTVLESPSSEQRKVLSEIVRLSSRVVSMASKGIEFLNQAYGVPEEKIDLIPHGIPDVPFVDSSFTKDRFGVDGRTVLLTFGLLSPNKGIENVIEALPRIVAEFPDVVYMVVGATHPNLVREQGETYRVALERLAARLGVERNIIFFNQFVETEQLLEFIAAADIYITPYLNKAQITSGTLAYSFGAGKAVISTPYWHAEEMLADGCGVLIPFGDTRAVADAVLDLLKNPQKRHAMRKKAYKLGREMIWSNVAHLYMASFERARMEHKPGKRVRTLDRKRGDLLEVRLDHLRRMTDSTGLLQHAIFALPNFEHGYCVDDNARALVLMILLQEMGEGGSLVEELGVVYASFLNHAFDPVSGRFRNFMSFDRRWLEEMGSEDSHGRSIWALGTVVGRSNSNAMRGWARELLEAAVLCVPKFHSPRAWAFTILGVHEYLRTLSGDLRANKLREDLAERLYSLYRANSEEGWRWFEPCATYDNPRLPQALLLAGRWIGSQDYLNAGLEALQWLDDVQRAPAGHFRPIGSNGFYQKGGEPAMFDQQPVEAWAMVSAALEAYRITAEEKWMDVARRAFDWFTGSNDLGVPLLEARTGGCRDGLHVDRPNENQGAESTLAFLLALAEMRQVSQKITAFESAKED